jgi:ATP citrate (pro-S)-lyase
MSAKAIREFDGKHLLGHFLGSPIKAVQLDFDQASFDQVFAEAEQSHPWLLTEKLVVKPDQLIKRRGKAGLVGINLDWSGVRQWIMERARKTIKVIDGSLLTGR